MTLIRSLFFIGSICSVFCNRSVAFAIFFSGVMGPKIYSLSDLTRSSPQEVTTCRNTSPLCSSSISEFSSSSVTSLRTTTEELCSGLTIGSWRSRSTRNLVVARYCGGWKKAASTEPSRTAKKQSKAIRLWRKPIATRSRNEKLKVPRSYTGITSRLFIGILDYGIGK